MEVHGRINLPKFAGCFSENSGPDIPNERYQESYGMCFVSFFDPKP